MSIHIENYSDKCIVVRGIQKEDKTKQEKVKACGGKWNGGIGGWIFPKKKSEEVEKLIKSFETVEKDEDIVIEDDTENNEEKEVIRPLLKRKVVVSSSNELILEKIKNHVSTLSDKDKLSFLKEVMNLV